MIAAGAVTVPEGLNAYPVALAFRFGLAALVAFSLFFAISSGTTRTAAYVLAPIAIVIVAEIFLSAMGVRLNLIGTTADMLLQWPGPLEIFTGRWLLVDV
jgi:hypothetical protein